MALNSPLGSGGGPAISLVKTHFPLGNFKIPQGSRHDKKGDFKIHQGKRNLSQGRGRFPLGDLLFPLGEESLSYAFLPAPHGVLRFPLGKSARLPGDFLLPPLNGADPVGEYHNPTRWRRNDTIPQQSPPDFLKTATSTAGHRLIRLRGLRRPSWRGLICRRPLVYPQRTDSLRVCLDLPF